MSSKSFTLSAALCLALAVGPASILAAPQPNGLPLLGGIAGSADPAPTTGNSEHDAGLGYDVGIPGGPGVRYGLGTHSEHHGPCGPGVDSEHDAGLGYDVGIPGGPSVRFGAGTHDAHQAVPCPEIVEVSEVPPPAEETSTYIPSMIPPTYTTPIVIPTATPPPTWAPATPVPAQSTPLIPHPAPTATPSHQPSMPVFNAGSALAPTSFLAVALPIILGFVY
ncbi:hypothetical protein N7462_003813 [Penicillium macrosclerotiorum]|uniref:uncharacterized protein n=1 Tax=Penicillium macrosclerotiorum TaxID=303699 RepID=UPI002548AFAE|nr:uncharacterized protein N7462_003813 [Penicillium macrosclerotiorum]KAJ5689421.1 hypothetical protein N7462_003813 [Penicillium macrosclerotiorum]